MLFERKQVIRRGRIVVVSDVSLVFVACFESVEAPVLAALHAPDATH